jgi:hypothetical protein
MTDIRRPSDSDHPDDLLAGLVDGTLTGAERADLQAHLGGCEHCRDEVALAERAERALRSLPELDAPWGLGREAIEEARKGVRGPRNRRFAAVAGIAAAAVLVVGLAVSVLRAPQGDNGASATGPTGGVTAPKEGSSGGANGGQTDFAQPGPEKMVIHDRSNYDEGRINGLAESYASQLKSRPQAPPEPEPTTNPAFTGGTTGGGTTGTSGPATTAGASLSGPATTDSVRSAEADNTARDVRCLDAAAGYNLNTRPYRVIVGARFQEKPALIGVYLRGPGAGQAADLVVVWVSSPAPECSFLHFAQHRIAP